MKFKKLVNKVEKQAEKLAQGSRVKPEKMQQLLQLLIDKKASYEQKLDSIEDEGKRQKLKSRIKIVDAQLQKAKRLLG